VDTQHTINILVMKIQAVKGGREVRDDIKVFSYWVVALREWWEQWLLLFRRGVEVKSVRKHLGRDDEHTAWFEAEMVGLTLVAELVKTESCQLSYGQARWH